MKSKKVYVLKKLIVELNPHPEFYGEAIAVLENGMWTDVYSDGQGEYYTYTNDKELIKYLKKHYKTNS